MMRKMINSGRATASSPRQPEGAGKRIQVVRGRRVVVGLDEDDRAASRSGRGWIGQAVDLRAKGLRRFAGREVPMPCALLRKKPSLAGIVNSAGKFRASSASELTAIYSNMSNALDFRDITSGKAGRNRAGTGWDFVTGMGSDQGLNGK